MPRRVSLEAISSQGQLAYTPTEKRGPQVEIPELNALALRSLATLYDAKAGFFSRSVAFDEKGCLHRQKTSPKRTIIALLGLHRLKESGESLPFDVRSICDAVVKDTSWVKSLGDLGLLTWLIAECQPDGLKNLFHKFEFASAIEDYRDGRQAQTRGLAWFLAGIAHAHLAHPQTAPELIDVAVSAYHLLEDNYGDSGIFGHAALPGFVQRTFYQRFGTFSDQIYSIYALVTFARAFQIEEPLGLALNCGNAIRELQGELGQWWFLYDKRTSRVLGQYPVFSLHQTGTAPLGLRALEGATGQSFHIPVQRGLSWVAGTNELGLDMRDMDRAVIWDSIESKKSILNHLDAAIGFVGLSHRVKQESLRIRRMSRPDQFGWLLYAFGAQGLLKAAPTTKPVGNRADSTGEKLFVKLW